MIASLSLRLVNWRRLFWLCLGALLFVTYVSQEQNKVLIPLIDAVEYLKAGICP